MSEEVRAEWESLPTGLKVLAVDDDPLCLMVVERMLRRCNYEVRTAENGRDALAKLREKDSSIDLVLSDVYMPDMDGFKLLETIGLELDLPVIMMSSNGDTNVVLRGVTHGAVDFLIKPVRIEEIRNVWQHIVRRRSQNVTREYSSGEGAAEQAHNEKKRKEAAATAPELEDNASTKKPRVVWSVEMHQQFVNAVNSLGIDKAVPKRILDQMDVEGLTRENVASHLQKYRLYLKRVSGVQAQPGNSRGRFSRNPSMDTGQHDFRQPVDCMTLHSGHMQGDLGGNHLGDLGAGPSLHVDGLDERESLHLRMPMGQIPSELNHIHGRVPFSPSQGGLDPMTHPEIKLEPTHSSTAERGEILADHAAASPSSYFPMRNSQNYNHLVPIPTTHPAVSAYDRSSISPMTGSTMGFGEFQNQGGLEELSLHNPNSSQPDLLDQPGLLTQNSSEQDLLGPPAFGSADDLTNLQIGTEQDMEKFINAFLQPSE